MRRLLNPESCELKSIFIYLFISFRKIRDSSKHKSHFTFRLALLGETTMILKRFHLKFQQSCSSVSTSEIEWICALTMRSDSDEGLSLCGYSLASTVAGV